MAVEMRVSDRGSGRSGNIGEAADIALPDQPSVTVTSQLFTQLAGTKRVVIHRPRADVADFVSRCDPHHAPPAS